MINIRTFTGNISTNNFNSFKMINFTFFEVLIDLAASFYVSKLSALTTRRAWGISKPKTSVSRRSADVPPTPLRGSVGDMLK